MKTSMKLQSVAALLAAVSVASPAFGGEGQAPRGVPHLDHVFVIMMENHGFNQIIGNPSAPFMNLYAKRVNLATNYFAVEVISTSMRWRTTPRGATSGWCNRQRASSFLHLPLLDAGACPGLCGLPIHLDDKPLCRSVLEFPTTYCAVSSINVRSVPVFGNHSVTERLCAIPPARGVERIEAEEAEHAQPMRQPPVQPSLIATLKHKGVGFAQPSGWQLSEGKPIRPHVRDAMCGPQNACPDSIGKLGRNCRLTDPEPARKH